ncbi:MAG: RagB/SusD family nutrient uptake outer membrane protein [Bacteroidota bacterium]
MKYLVKITFIILVAGFLNSCDDFLEIAPVTEISSANFFQTQEDAEAAIVGCFDALQPDSYYGFDIYIYGDVRSDNCFAGGDNLNNFAIDNFTERATNENITRTWRQIYLGIGRANTVIGRVGAMDPSVFDEGIQDRILGEAYFLRGLHYFNLVRLWGSVPLVLSETTSLDEDVINVGLTPEEDIYAQILLDFEMAQQLLPAALLPGRLSKGSAEAYLASTELTLGNFDEVERWTAQVMTRGFQLLPNFEDLFNQQNENNSEVIFSVQYTGGAEGNVFPELVLPVPEASFEFLKFNTPTPNSIAAFEAGDVRQATSFTERDGTLFIFKWRNGEAFASPDDNIIMRYADVLLMRAEALNQLNRTSEAIDLLNQIRNRAQLPDYSGPEDVTDVDEAIFNERRVELMYEGQRWFDLRRRGFQVAAAAILEAKGITITEAQLDFPIPQEEIDRNPNLN